MIGTKPKKANIEYVDLIENSSQIIIVESDSHLGTSSSSFSSPDEYEESSMNNLSLKQNLLNSGLSPHIVENYSILAQEITAPLEQSKIHDSLSPTNSAGSSSNSKQWSNNKKSEKQSKVRSHKDYATCQFCGLAMLKKNIPTHIRRAHTPKEELVCLNEEQNIFTFNHLNPGQRRKRSARAYDYSLMTATVKIDDDPTEGIENKFITEGEEILSTDLLQLADRIKYGVSQIPISTLGKVIDILSKIEFGNQGEVSDNAKSIKNMICFYLASGDDFKYKIRQVSEEIIEKKKQVSNLRSDLKEIMARKTQLERRIQPMVCDLQKLEDQHCSLIETIVQMNDMIHCELLPDHEDSGN